MGALSHICVEPNSPRAIGPLGHGLPDLFWDLLPSCIYSHLCRPATVHPSYGPHSAALPWSCHKFCFETGLAVPRRSCLSPLGRHCRIMRRPYTRSSYRGCSSLRGLHVGVWAPGRVHSPHRAPPRMRPSWVLGVQVGPRRARPPHLSRWRPLPLHWRPGRHVWPVQGQHPVDCLGPAVSALTSVTTPTALLLPVSVLSLVSLLPAPISVVLSAPSSTPVSALLVPVFPFLVLPVS